MRLTTTTILILTLAAARPLRRSAATSVTAMWWTGRAEQIERAKRLLTREEMPPSETTMFIDASVLMNVKADEFVATFGVAEEAETIEGCQAKMDATIAAFTEAPSCSAWSRVPLRRLRRADEGVRLQGRGEPRPRAPRRL